MGKACTELNIHKYSNQAIKHAHKRLQEEIYKKSYQIGIMGQFFLFLNFL